MDQFFPHYSAGKLENGCVKKCVWFWKGKGLELFNDWCKYESLLLHKICNGHFIMLGGFVKKTLTKFLIQIYILLQRILKTKFHLKPEHFFLVGINEQTTRKKPRHIVFIYDCCCRKLYVQKWKDSEIVIIEKWLIKMINLAEMQNYLVYLEKDQLLHLLVTGNFLWTFCWGLDRRDYEKKKTLM